MEGTKAAAGERVVHAVMGIVYGVFLTLLYPHAAGWSRLGTGFTPADYRILSRFLTVFAIGVLASGLRDLAASRKLSQQTPVEQ